MDRRELNWQDLRLFLAVAEQGSFSAAARELRLGQPTLSRRIAELEEQFSQRLFTRLSHGCELTTLGLKLLPTAQQMAQWANQAQLEASSATRIAGLVRITAPPGVALNLLTLFAQHLCKKYPDVQLEILSNVNTLNLARGEADISLRTTLPDDADLYCLASYGGSMQVYVARGLVRSLPENVQLNDLNWICWSEEFDHFQLNQALKSAIPNFRPALSSNDYNIQIAACCAGVGALVLPIKFDQYGLFKDMLEPLPIDISHFPKGELHMVTHKRQRHLPRVVAVMEELESYFSEMWPIVSAGHIP
jgi:DNA-binding transcriptional LysR family regulator